MKTTHHTLSSETTHHRDLFTVTEVAELLRVDTTTIRRWIKAGTFEALLLPHKGIRKSYRISRETLEKLLGEPLPLLPSQ